jgi:predicted peptidase
MRISVRTATLVLVAMVCGGCVTKSMSGKASNLNSGTTGFLNRVMDVNGKQRAYVVYVPRDYDPATAWPLVMFLHGAGERGDDGMKQSDVGIGRAIRFHPDRFPAIVVMPQCPERVWWDAATADIDISLAQSLKEFNVDKDRVYLTGLSMGGYGTWIYGAKHAGTFAALYPICGGGREDDAKALAKVPIWAFHGEDDRVVKPEESKKMVDAVQAAGGLVKYTEFPKTDHNSWDKAYDDAAALKWLFSQRLSNRR